MEQGRAAENLCKNLINKKLILTGNFEVVHAVHHTSPLIRGAAMGRRKYSKLTEHRRGARAVKSQPGAAMPAPPEPANEILFVPAPKLRRMLGVSAVTLWRWRQDEAVGFPRATTINGRNYFPWAGVRAWLAARQQQVA